MSNHRTVAFLITLFFTFISHPAHSGVPDTSLSEAFIAFPGPGPAVLMVVPNGQGTPFTEAQAGQPTVVDATITLFVRDGAGVPISNYPFEDMWLESQDGGMVPCVGGAVADASTNVDGMTRWADPLFAGGFSTSPMLVFINGSVLTSSSGFSLHVNSPDINGDGSVNLQDLAVFSADYYSVYNFRSDYNADNAVNLTDVPLFAAHYGVICP